jgi:D-sedoheptulose 7-phosphate isomerase
MSSSEYLKNYLDNSINVINQINKDDYNLVLEELIKLKNRQGRLFLLGVGGSAANCSHAVNDFRKLCNIETYAPTDNVSELTARTNDEGWETVFSQWLKTSRLNKNDALMVFSVGGGNLEKNISTNIVSALQYGQEVGATILGIVSRDGGYTKQVANACVLIPTISDNTITPYAEAFQGLLWHGIVNYPELRGEKSL